MIKQTITFLFLMLSLGLNAQQIKGKSTLSISGTSTLHDWTMASSQGTLELTLKSNTISSLEFSVIPTTLLSGHSAMDKNAWNALKSNTITFTSTSITFNGEVYKAVGDLSIAGKSLHTEVSAIVIISDNTFIISGSKKISMKDFGVIPPTFMMGTIKTGNDIVVEFNSKLIK